MTISRTHRRLVIAVAFWLGATAASLEAQDTFARAKDFYANAAYEEALVLLQRLGASSPVNGNEVAAYQVFCLVALGRSDEARQTIETMVKTDPLYKLSAAQASPRVRAFFEDVRRPLLPEIIKQTYTKAKDAYEKKDHTTAAAEFDRAISLIDEVGTANDRGLADLKTLATGFRDLSKAAVAAATLPPPQLSGDAPGGWSNPAPGTTATNGPAKPATPPSPPVEPTYGPKDPDVTRPVTINRTMPEWRPSAVEAMMEFRGSIELLIGPDGKVISAVITDSVHPQYDEPLRKAALNWTFKPATKGGKPVRYRYAVDVQLKKQP